MSDATVAAGLYLCGPMSVPSDNLNLTSIKSWVAAIDELPSKTPLQNLITLSNKPGWFLQSEKTQIESDEDLLIGPEQQKALMIEVNLGVHTLIKIEAFVDVKH